MRKEYTCKKARPTKPNKTREELVRDLINSLPDDVLDELLKYGIDQVEKDNSDKGESLRKKIIMSSNLSCRELAIVLCLSKSHVDRIKKGWSKKQKPESEILKNARLIIKESNYEIGRGPIAQKLLTQFNIKVSDRHCGRILTNAGYFCSIRRSKIKPVDPKETNVNIPNIVQRDYDNIHHDETILATDVTYIPCTHDLPHRHLYVSFVFNHRFKSIDGWAISSMNNVELVLESFKDIELNNNIIHSDHGSQYSSIEFMEMVKKNNCIQSMSRIANALDNRCVEFSFSVFKTELISKLDYENLTFNELKNEIEKWIYYYNYERIQKKLSWKTPLQL